MSVEELSHHVSIGRGMAKPTEVTTTSIIGEFCCASRYAQLQVCTLRQHVELVKKKLESIDEENREIHKLTKFLTLMSRTLSSVEQEFEAKKKQPQDPNLKARQRYLTGPSKNQTSGQSRDVFLHRSP